MSIVTEIFQGEFESRVECLHCSKVSITREPFQDLSLPIPSNNLFNIFSDISLIGRKEMTKLRKQDSDDHSPPTTTTIGGRVCHAWNTVFGVARDIVTGPPTSLDDCLGAFFDSSDLSGTHT